MVRLGRRIGTPAAVLLVISAAAGGTAVQAAEAISPDRFTALDAYLASAREQIGIPGLALVVVEGNQIIHLTALGVADTSGRPITAQTPFMLASTSKAFTALAVMQQVEAGRIDLDAPIQRYLPWFTVADPTAAAQITLRQLLYHTSGLSPTSGQAYHDSDDQDAGALERAVRALATSALVSAPGAEHHYSNSNYDVLGLVVQTVSGEPFSQYVEEHVFAPLDMRHSHATVDAARADGLAAGFYHWFGVTWQPAPIPLPRAGGPSATMFVSAEDLGHELIAHLNGGRYGSTQVLSSAGIATLHAPGVRTDDFHSYAMGWDVRPLWEALDPTAPDASHDFALPALVEHSGEWADGHSYVGFVPAESWGFALLVNAWDFAEASRFSLLEQNVLRILEGHDPIAWTSSEEPFTQNGRLVAAALFAAELAGLAWWVVRLRRGVSAARRRRPAFAGVLSLALDALVVWLYVVYAPVHFDSPFLALIRESPDVGLMALPALAMALVWGPIRTILVARALLRKPSENPPVAAPSGA